MFQLSSGDIKKERMFLTGGQGVAGSNPVIPTNITGLISIRPFFSRSSLTYTLHAFGSTFNVTVL